MSTNTAAASRAAHTHFTGQTVWIIGASSGIGAALARQLSVCGAQLLLSARNKQRLDRVANLCRANGASCTVFPVDLTEKIAGDALFRQAQAQAHAPAIDCVIYAAGVSQRACFADTTDATIDTILRTNLTAYIAIAHAAMQHIRAGTLGHMVFVGSLAGCVSTPLRSIYSASKAALHSLAETLALEARSHGAKIQLVIPGFIRTDISLHALTADGTPQQILNSNQKRGMTAERCAAKIVRFLTSNAFELAVGLGVRGRVSLAMRKCCPKLLRKLLLRVRTT